MRLSPPVLFAVAPERLVGGEGERPFLIRAGRGNRAVYYIPYRTGFKRIALGEAPWASGSFDIYPMIRSSKWHR